MARRDPPREVLATRWAAPEDVEGGAGEPVLCIATTFGLHASLLESDLLVRFLGLRFDGEENEPALVVERERRLAEVPVHVLVDAAKVDPGQTTLRWSQVPVRVPGAIQHSKVSLLVWERCVRVIVASANLTKPGYRFNREMAGVLDVFDSPDSAPLRIVFDTLDFLDVVTEFATAAPGAVRRLKEGIQSARRRIKRWRRAPVDYGSRSVPRVHFVGGYPRTPSGGSRRSVLEQAIARWGERRVGHARVVTPFVGDERSGRNQVAARLAALPWSRQGFAMLGVPGHRQEKADVTTVELPRRFLESWARAWRKTPTT